MSACISPSESLWQAPPRLDETPLALRLVELTQAGLPLLEDPWAWLAEQLELSVESTLDLLKRLQAEGAIRRIAAVPNHYRLGYRHNGMTVWDVADADISRLGALLGRSPSSATATGARASPAGATTCSPWSMAAAAKKSTATANTCATCWGRLRRRRHAGEQPHPEKNRPAPFACGSKACSRNRCVGFMKDRIGFIAGKPCSHQGLLPKSGNKPR